MTPRKITDEQIIEHAQSLVDKDIVQVEDDVTRTDDKTGAWVNAYVWVDFSNIPEDEC